MENSAECVEAKTPRRARRSSATELGSVSKAVRSARSIRMPEIEEGVDASSAPKTPSRTAKQPEYRTPSKSEAMTLAQTPRRSARKSIKPIQENIVAQKGLKQDDEEPTVEWKWVPAAIEGGPAKRGKKASRGNGKGVKRQRRFTEDSEDNEEDHCELKTNDLKSHVDGLQSAIIEEQLPDGMDAVDEKKNDVGCEPSAGNEEEKLVVQKIESDREEQSQVESEEKKDLVDQISLTTDESLGGKENIDTEHVVSDEGDIFAAEKKIDIDDIAWSEVLCHVVPKTEVDSQEEKYPDETVSADEDAAPQVKNPFAEETAAENVNKKQVSNVEVISKSFSSKLRRFWG